MNWYRLIPFMILCATFFKTGMPLVVIYFRFDFFRSFIIAIGSAFIGSIIYTYLSYYLIQLWKHIKLKVLAQPHKIFTSQNRKIIKIKNKFGLTGIALLSPILLSIPLGAFLAEKFFKNKAKIILYLNASAIFWFIIIYLLMKFFYAQLKGILF